MTGPIARYFRFAERSTDLATELRAGLTTYMVMAYIIFVNPSVLGLVGVPGLEGKGLPFAATLTATCLTAGVLSIAMGLASNYPLVLAPGMGLNAVVAFELVATRGLTWPQAMTVVFLEGVAITLLVLTRFRETVMDAVPLGLKRAIGVGIGLFIAFIGFFTSGFVVKPLSGPLPVALGTFGGLPAVVFVLGFILTAWLMARRVRGALLLGIVLTTLLAIVLNGALASWQGFSTPGAARIPAAIVEPPDLSTVGRLDFGLVARLGVVSAVLVTFSIMLSDFFDTMGTIIGVGGKAGFLDARGRLPGGRRGRPLPPVHVLLAARGCDPRPGDRARADHRRLLHDDDRAGHPLGGLRGGDPRVRDDAGDAVHLVDHQRNRRGLRDLQRDQDAQRQGTAGPLDGSPRGRGVHRLLRPAAHRARDAIGDGNEPTGRLSDGAPAVGDGAHVGVRRDRREEDVLNRRVHDRGRYHDQERPRRLRDVRHAQRGERQRDPRRALQIGRAHV